MLHHLFWNQYILTMTLCEDYEMKSNINSKQIDIK